MEDLLYVQDDGKIFARCDNPLFASCRRQLNTFTVLMEQQEPMYVYKVTETSLWKAASLGLSPRDILDFLRTYSASPLPISIQQSIAAEMNKWGLFTLIQFDHEKLQFSFPETWSAYILGIKVVQDTAARIYKNRIIFDGQYHGLLKQALARHGIPVKDEVNYPPCPRLNLDLKYNVTLRDYQRAAVQSFLSDHFHESGLIILPCGSGKTLVGLAILCKLKYHTLIVTPSDSAAVQWLEQLEQYTTISPELTGRYKPAKSLYPITVTTYQQISGRNQRGFHQHLQRLAAYPWGLVIYDEVHVLPAPLFRLAAGLQTARRLGLTATLVREDRAEADVYGLIGPTCYEGDWKALERQGYLAEVKCVELRVPLPERQFRDYCQARPRDRHRIAAENPRKLEAVSRLLQQHQDEQVLIIGHYLQPLEQLAQQLQLPVITGQTPSHIRNTLYEKFRSGAISCLVLSRVANMAVDLPKASVGIEISGLYASRQEEAQRLGRLLRPKQKIALFYTLVSAQTVEVDNAQKRQRFLTERGYHYEIQYEDGEGMRSVETPGLSELRSN